MAMTYTYAHPEMSRNRTPITAMQFAESAVAVPATGTGETSEILLYGLYDRVAFQITNNGPTNAFDAMVIEAKAHSDGAWTSYVTSAQLNTGTAIAGLLILVVTNPTTLAADGVSFIVINTTGLYSVRITISSDTDAVTADVIGTAGTGRQ